MCIYIYSLPGKMTKLRFQYNWELCRTKQLCSLGSLAETCWIHNKSGNLLDLLGIIFSMDYSAEIFARKLALGETATQNARQGIVICSNLSSSAPGLKPIQDETIGVV